MASVIGTSMLSRPWRSATHALRKNGTPEKAIAGSAIAAEIQWNMSRVTSSAPAQTETESSITFIAAKPATASRISRSRPARSVAVALSVPASSSCASKPSPSTSARISSGVTSGAASMLARLSVRLTRAERTPGCAPRPDSIFEMQAAQWIVGSDSAMRASGRGRAA